MDSNEKNTEDLAQQLAQANERIEQMSRETDDLKLDRQLMQKLAAAGAVDLEAALLMARARTSEPGDVGRAIEQLKTEKRYLFTDAGSSEKPASRKTAGAKDRAGSRSVLLEQAAKKAARTGSRADLQEYLRLRRNAM
jgi:hypothetical protein